MRWVLDGQERPWPPGLWSGILPSSWKPFSVPSGDVGLPRALCMLGTVGPWGAVGLAHSRSTGLRSPSRNQGSPVPSHKV